MQAFLARIAPIYEIQIELEKYLTCDACGSVAFTRLYEGKYYCCDCRCDRCRTTIKYGKCSFCENCYAVRILFGGSSPTQWKI